MRRKTATRFEPIGEDSGAILPLVTLMLVVLMGMAAFATDLGWMFVNSSRIQRAAEASALSAVVELPVNPAAASAVAYDVANRNGYPPATVTPQPMPGGADTRMRVTITETIDLFFLSIFGLDTQTITREATAEYFPPLPLGSSGSQFGNSCAAPAPCGGGQPNFWANIHGRDITVDLGDAYSSRCATGEQSGSPGCAVNPDYRQSGYLYGIEANGGVPFTVEFIDIEFRYDSTPVQATSDFIRTGDRGCELDAWGPGTGNPNPGDPCGPGIRIELFGPDATPLDLSDNPLICVTTVNRLAQVLETDPYPPFSSPAGCLTVANPSQGIYVLQVEVAPPGGPLGNAGLNRYSVRATGGARLYGIGDVSVYNRAPGSSAQYDLVEVSDIHRGKTLVIEMFDLGDEFGSGTVQIRDPNGVVQATFPAGSSNDGAWRRREIQLSDTYSCGTSCWWTANYSISVPVTDTTTWRAYVEGAPIWVIPNT